jgi:phage terminase small subunit
MQSEIDRLNEQLAQGSVLHAAREQAMKELEHRLQVQGEYLNRRLDESERVADREVGRRKEFEERNRELISESHKQQQQVEELNQVAASVQSGAQ